MQVGIFGGSFDPPHVGHVLGAAYALLTGEIERLIVVPTFVHPFAKGMCSFSHRLRLCDRAFERLDGVEVSAVEANLAVPSLTLRTLEHLQSEHPDWSLRLIVGSDVLAEKDQWHAFSAVEQLAPLLVLGRQGFPVEGIPQVLPDVSSTFVRELLRADGSGAPRADVKRFVPHSALAYIEKHGLYRTAS